MMMRTFITNYIEKQLILIKQRTIVNVGVLITVTFLQKAEALEQNGMFIIRVVIQENLDKI